MKKYALLVIGALVIIALAGCAPLKKCRTVRSTPGETITIYPDDRRVDVIRDGKR